jgi:hypothetical protein
MMYRAVGFECVQYALSGVKGLLLIYIEHSASAKFDPVLRLREEGPEYPRIQMIHLSETQNYYLALQMVEKVLLLITIVS